MENTFHTTKTCSGAANKPLVTIILAAFNGEKYLKDQLDSIINQSWTNWELIIRDDGSSDRTLSILVTYQLNDARIKILYDDKENLGICMNFAELMEYSASSKYLMFSDQDDIWLSTKIEDTYEAMKASELLYGEIEPLLVHTDLSLVDDHLSPIAYSAENFIKLKPQTPNKLNHLLAQNYIYGCTVMINKALLKQSLPIPPEAENHDYWVSLIAASVGHITYVPKSYILYRQHPSNFSGGISGGTFVNRVRRLAFGWNVMNNTIDIRIKQAFALYVRVENRLSNKNKNLLLDYLSRIKNGGTDAVAVAIKHKISRQGFLRTLMFYICLLKKRNFKNLHLN